MSSQRTSRVRGLIHIFLCHTTSCGLVLGGRWSHQIEMMVLLEKPVIPSAGETKHLLGTETTLFIKSPSIHNSQTISSSLDGCKSAAVVSVTQSIAGCSWHCFRRFHDVHIIRWNATAPLPSQQEIQGSIRAHIIHCSQFRCRCFRLTTVTAFLWNSNEENTEEI